MNKYACAGTHAPQVGQSWSEDRLHDLSGLVHAHDQELQQLSCRRRVEKTGRDGGFVLTQETTLQTEGERGRGGEGGEGEKGKEGRRGRGGGVVKEGEETWNMKYIDVHTEKTLRSTPLG